LSSWSASPEQNKRQRKEGEWKFVLIKKNTESKNWSITEENIALQGLFEVTVSSREAEICQAIGNVTWEKYLIISDHNLQTAKKKNIYN